MILVLDNTTCPPHLDSPCPDSSWRLSLAQVDFWVLGASDPHPVSAKRHDVDPNGKGKQSWQARHAIVHAQKKTAHIKHAPLFWDDHIDNVVRKEDKAWCGKKADNVDHHDSKNAQTDAEDTDSGDAQPVEAWFCPIHEVAAVFEHPVTYERSSVLHSLVELNDPGLFDCEVPGLIVQYKWDAYAKDIMRERFYGYLAMTVCFTAHCLTAIPTMHSVVHEELHCN
eukprot:SAG11_NODE_457_length_9306_cov_2.887803_9_plen_225_part_00